MSEAASIDWWAVEEAIREVVSEGGLAGVSVIGPDGIASSWNGERRFRAASTIKIAVMLEIFRQIEYCSICTTG